ncbi:hypothetical protein [Trueperella pecoris]|uniref:hypothetical protein n=1 Tax=Trueperella pecoris TaxID=2733571 RepID=UPI001ABE20BE|nr:hypothetical protein [Trueperella pecoris]QTG75109.1 hypothetical protein J4179_07760 [Trueperella pecoris]
MVGEIMMLVDGDLWNSHDLSVGRVSWRANLGTQPVDVDTDSLRDWAMAQRGHWVAVVRNEHGVFGVTDNLRSFPILYTHDAELLVSSTPTALLEDMSAPRRNSIAAAEFTHGGYLLGPQTLIEEVYSVQAGSVVDLNTGQLVDTYRMPTSYVESDADPMEYMRFFYDVVVDQFKPLAETKHQLLVPLSGGADSRLIMLALRAAGAENVLAFTYGTPGSAEVCISQEVARAAGYTWKAIELDRAKVHQLWVQPQTGEFLKDAWSGESLPHIQDWYALHELRNDPDVAADAIVLPGHTIVGNEHGDDILAGHPVSIDGAMDLLTEHHFHLQGKKHARELPLSLRQRLRSFLEENWKVGDRAHNSKALVELNLLTRQARYINNSMRGYEHFGFDWALPMLTADAWDAWLSAPQALHTEDRHYYVRFINEEFSRAFSSELTYFTTRVGTIEPERKRKIKAALSSLHILDLVLDLARIRTERRHPMAFEALAGSLKQYQYDMRLIRGQRTLGIYAELFLANEWVPGQTVVPQE